MSPALRQTLITADGFLRQGDARSARTALESFAAQNETEKDGAEFQFLLAQAYFQAGDAGSARAAADRAIAERPEWAEAHQLRGTVLADLELFADAAQSLEHALTLQPGNARVCANLGAVLRRRGMPAEAVTMYRRAIALNPSYAHAWRGLAELLQAIDQSNESLAAWRRWSELVLDKADALAELGWALARARRWAAAEIELEQAVAQAGADHRADTRLAYVRRERGDVEGALSAYRRGCARSPAALTPRFGAALALPQVYSDSDDLRKWRARYTRGMAELRSQLPKLLETPEALWDLDWSNFYLGYQGGDDLALQRQYADLISSLAEAAAPEWAVAPEPSARGNRRLRVGFASSHFRRCTVGAYFESWLGGLDPRRFEIFAFYLGTEIDATTQVFRTLVDQFIQPEGGVRDIARRIRASRLDVLIYPQLGMDGRDATLAALRLAPVQCAAWGHPVTTGSAAIDFYFSCAAMEPTDAASHYSERLLLLPGLGTNYARPDVRSATREEFLLPEGVPLYVCPQSLFKIHPDNDQLFGDVLTFDARGRLVFCAELGEPVTTRFQERIRCALERRGIDAARRVIWQPMRPAPEFRAMLATCDVMLDTLHWSGGNTSLDAVAARLPIVTHAGHFLRGRQSAAMLRIIGLSQLVATKPSDMARIASGIANESAAAIREEIGHASGLLFGRQEPVRALEQHLLQITGWEA